MTFFFEGADESYKIQKDIEYYDSSKANRGTIKFRYNLRHSLLNYHISQNNYYYNLVTNLGCIMNIIYVRCCSYKQDQGQ